MLQYPSILGVKKMPIGLPCIAFYKYDGSNLRFEWSPKKGWHKYGSRTQMIDGKSPIYGQGIELFHDTMGDIIVERLKSFMPKQFKNWERITAFAEFYGENSFAGSHDEKDEKKLCLFDVFLFQKGFLKPDNFVDYFGDLDWSSKVVYRGNLNKEFIEKIRYNTLEGEILNEGVICKGVSEKINFKTQNNIWMTKIKTYEYINKLKHKYDEKWENYAE